MSELETVLAEMRSQVRHGLPPRSDTIERWANVVEAMTRAAPPPELRNDERGQLDDVVIHNVKLFRMERMDKGSWWMRLDMPDRSAYVLHITTSGREITVTAESEAP